MRKKQIFTGILVALAMLVGVAATTHAAAPEGADHVANCVACGLCEMIHALLS
jgi:hypothetical protein